MAKTNWAGLCGFFAVTAVLLMGCDSAIPEEEFKAFASSGGSGNTGATGGTSGTQPTPPVPAPGCSFPDADCDRDLLCDGINLLSDNNNCGYCNLVCSDADSCTSGVCRENCVAAKEICNGIDDDCDGFSDEGYEAGVECLLGEGACAARGYVRCQADGSSACTAETGAPTTETCNGVDDDCDGLADEELQCDCSPQPETCDGVDNDCDSLVDENHLVGSTCSVGTGACMRLGFMHCQEDGSSACSASPGSPTTEICDGIDNDCDGQADEGLESCDRTATIEVCDGVDNDLDGLVDEDYGVASTCMVGVGQCSRAGIVLCEPDGSSACSATPGAPQSEICDGIDNDCSGAADEGLDCACNSSAETCDGTDNDCDLVVDEGFATGTSCVVGTGVCQAVGYWMCNATGDGVNCSATPGAPLTEECNGRDDDCDGLVDEGLDCACNPHPEYCDGTDNDCNGIVDDGFNVGSNCAVGVGNCQSFGYWSCQPDGSVACSAVEGAPGTEVCNGLDDDCNGMADDGLTGCDCSASTEVCDGVDNSCDGQIDEGFPVTMACTVGEGACARTGIYVCNTTGGVDCSATEGLPATEICDGIDNNCDGQADESLVGCDCYSEIEVCDGVDNDCDGLVDEGCPIGNPCPVGTGACARTGIYVIDGAGGVVCNASPGTPGTEVCNGIDDNCDGSADEGLTDCDCSVETEVCDGVDNDCDGLVDEGFGVGTTCNVGDGACARVGLTLCDGLGSTMCSSIPGTPETEVCNGIDDDCNGQADEGLSCDCSPEIEVCDGIDNNCDGTVDEGYPIGTVCQVGVGACTRVGALQCTPTGSIECSATEGAPSTEVCNGIDDDCNGVADNGLTGCDCVVETEVCDGRDNDCDGVTDEGCPIGDPCVVGTGACMRMGIFEIDGVGGVVCNASPGTPGTEVCNGIDDDCDGTPDNGLTGCSCYAHPEVCDGTDNDCNGAVDEGFSVGSSCLVGIGACERGGLIICDAAGGSICSAVPGTPGVEICNGVDDNCDGQVDEGLTCDCSPQPEACDGYDNDCDGSVDEDFTVLGTTCVVGVGACERFGYIECSGPGGTQCSATEGTPGTEVCNGVDDDCNGSVDDGLVGCDCSASAEICNGVDDDCDGDVDEGFPVGSDCMVGVGDCQRTGYFLCDGTGVVCSATPGTAGTEVCDGNDNDCNGAADDGLVCSCSSQPEICDGTDNDCDFVIDEGFNVGSDCQVGVGACQRNGLVLCDNLGGTVCSATAGSPVAEVCNGIDDDCDGTADEGLACTCDPLTEVCNGIDDDCDGSVDNGFPIGGSCTVGIGQCARNGTLICDGSGGVTCSATAGSPIAEVCNGVDDNCDGVADNGISCDLVAATEVCDGVDNDLDGATDEGFPVGNACLVGTGACERLGQFICDGAGGTICSVTAGTPGVETCNGIDDDCDGTADEGGICPACTPFAEECNGIDDDCDGGTDEGFGLGSNCSVGVGACTRVGVNICNATGGTQCSAVPGPAGVETCNGIDDDCDGVVDEGLSCACSPEAEVCDGRDNDCDGTVDNGYSVGTVCSVGTGACQRNGINLCQPGGGAACSATQGTPGVETCNGIDDDCDGNVDEGLSCGCVPSTEICNGIDDNCNGLVDDGFNVGTNCSVGTGACRREGFFVCDGLGGQMCSASPGAAIAEICNGIDDNCNGIVDDGLFSCSCAPQTEVCDGVDNDCDGQIDEGYNVGNTCSAGTGACLRNGYIVCQGGGTSACSVTAGTPSSEGATCDGVDNDCDSQIDEGLSCVGPTQAEICNGIDDNYNGTVDEGYAVGSLCLAGIGACQRTGLNICNGVGLVCTAVAGSPSGEVCNGIDDDCDGIADEGLSCSCSPTSEICDGTDNDCDGSTDEGFGVGNSCATGTGACRRQGLIVCQPGGGAACSATAGTPSGEVCNGIDDDCDGVADEGLSCGCVPSTEICDGTDNDCDGLTDEGFSTGSTCTQGIGACQRTGIIICNGPSSTICSATAGLPVAETCNGIDDDCDGVVDEGCAPACVPTGPNDICFNGIDDDCDGFTDGADPQGCIP